MPIHAHDPDYLDRHLRIAKRVRDLETGVHPVRALADFWASTAPAALSLVPLTVGTDDDGIVPMWMKRTGFVLLMGRVLLNHAVPAGGLTFATLADNARPILELSFDAVADKAPYRASITAKVNGDLVLKAPGLPIGASGVGALVALDGIGWPQG